MFCGAAGSLAGRHSGHSANQLGLLQQAICGRISQLHVIVSMTEPKPDAAPSILPPPEDESDSPPRKRPRTRAPPQVAATNMSTVDIAPQSEHQSLSQSVPQSVPDEQSSQVRRFPIHPLDRFQGASARIKRPSEVAHFSYDDNHEYRDDESSINYYVPPPIGADLKEGFGTFKHYEEKEDPHLDSLLRALVHKESNALDDTTIKADFVTWRGMMTKVS